ncbi:MAG: hypothetical protein HFH93_06085 [Lachnospiraceae bacterium]|nr:hypothetical protein [Lachnospiraceae bacterium]
MESKDYKIILNSMPETAIYVIRQDNHSLLYFNKRVHTVSPEVRLGMTCHEVWTGSCINCPLLTIQDRQESRSLSYNATFGGVVDMVATRMLWKDTIPAFVVSVTPRIESSGYVYRKILRLDLGRNRYDVLKFDGATWLSPQGTENLSREFENLAGSGMVHPEDADRFRAFTDIAHLRNALRGGKSMLTCIYRRLYEQEFRWNLVEVVPAFDYSEENETAMFCVKDVHDTMREGLEREEDNVRSRDALLTVSEQSFGIYAVHLDSGTVDLIREEGHEPRERFSEPPVWDDFMQSHIIKKLHPAYQDAFWTKFSLAGLIQAKKAGEKESELLCQLEIGGSYRYVSVTARLDKDHGAGHQAVLAMENMDEQIRKELAHSKRDVQIAAILKSRFDMMTTVNLDNGQCERIFLDSSSELQDAQVGDYNYYTQLLLPQLYPEDMINYSSLMSLEHLREKARATENYAEEICKYRTKDEPPRWLEQHIIYSRQNDRIVVNILGHDITDEKSKEDERLRAMQDRSYIISSLSSLFFSTYYIDIEQDTFRAVRKLGKAGDVLGSEVSCTAALQVYAENFIHPDDREAYLNVMNMSNLRQNLRWWQPYVSNVYRKLPAQGEVAPADYEWVNATVVLAQIGEDDLPKTAVYVAQDITETMQHQNRK